MVRRKYRQGSTGSRQRLAMAKPLAGAGFVDEAGQGHLASLISSCVEALGAVLQHATHFARIRRIINELRNPSDIDTGSLGGSSRRLAGTCEASSGDLSGVCAGLVRSRRGLFENGGLAVR